MRARVCVSVTVRLCASLSVMACCVGVCVFCCILCVCSVRGSFFRFADVPDCGLVVRVVLLCVFCVHTGCVGSVCVYCVLVSLAVVWILVVWNGLCWIVVSCPSFCDFGFVYVSAILCVFLCCFRPFLCTGSWSFYRTRVCCIRARILLGLR